MRQSKKKFAEGYDTNKKENAITHELAKPHDRKTSK